MRILFLTSRFPYPPHRGDRLTAYHLVRTFSKRHKVTLLSFVDGHEPPGSLLALRDWCDEIETVHLSRGTSWLQAWSGLLATTPSQVNYYRSGAMRQAVLRRLATGGYDVVFTQLFRMAPHVADVTHPAKILFLADSLALSLDRSLSFAPWWKRLGVMWERHRVAAFEPRMGERFRETWVLSDVDRRDLERRGCPRVVVLPHGVDERLFELDVGVRDSKEVFFLGNLSVPHNVDAARYLALEIWPLIRAEVPGASLEIAGADPKPEVQALAGGAGVAVPGAVDDLIDRWRRVAVLVAPLRYSTGIQNKVIEAMAAGVPVVTTPAVAAGIHAEQAGVVHMGDSTAELARLTVDVLQNPAAQAPMVAKAREFVRERFRWDLLRERLEALVKS